MAWVHCDISRDDATRLADPNCFCGGTGIQEGYDGHRTDYWPCDCVERKIREKTEKEKLKKTGIVTGQWIPKCPCPRCFDCSCGIENCANRLGGHDPCSCPWIELRELLPGQCFQAKNEIIYVVWKKFESESMYTQVRLVITTDGEDSELGRVEHYSRDTLIKPMTFSVPVPKPEMTRPDAPWKD
jgi:hypothetical protein